MYKNKNRKHSFETKQTLYFKIRLIYQTKITNQANYAIILITLPSAHEI